ncbi:hypothetical protein [Novosphingobium olei]|uniref:Lipoprotein n=1 Tax=Novosphingobium olei TaxID=2728851 RepID=A0A7Y0BTE6_9SPHN|nr:hypothetical protein [Novosphingobium olei]NML96058.1 hypothetical protein [Novosphingobium olei]BEV02256.1 hypothetical protein NSDW_33500 [Novosphingobium olei]
MKKFAITAFAAAAALSLAACGKSDDASQEAAPDNVEMPADDLPAVEPSAAAPAPQREVAPAADASQAAQSAEDAAKSAADSAVSAAEAARAAAAAAETGTDKPAAPPQQ